MTGFDASWLSLRFDADEAARGPATDAFLAGLAPLPSELRIVDLGAGSANNALHLAPRLQLQGVRRQRWVLVDDDAALLERAAERLSAVDADIEVELVRCNIAGELDAVPLEGSDVVTCSALFDLVSRHWLEALASRLSRSGVPAFLAALSIDGRVEWSPPDTYDAQAAATFHADMRRDKGFGLALAADAPGAAEAAFLRAGYDVRRVPSDWVLGEGAAALQRRYLRDVATTLALSEPKTEVSAWLARREAQIDGGAGRLVVGHEDVLCLRTPPRD